MVDKVIYTNRKDKNNMGGQIIASTKNAIHPRREILDAFRENGLLRPAEVSELLPMMSMGKVCDIMLELLSEDRIKPLHKFRHLNWDSFLNMKYYLARN